MTQSLPKPTWSLITVSYQILLFTLFGFQLAFFSTHYHMQLDDRLFFGLAVLWFFGLAQLSRHRLPAQSPLAVDFAASLLLLSAQYAIVYWHDHAFVLFLGGLFSFLGIGCALLRPWLCQTFLDEPPLATVLFCLIPFLGFALGHVFIAYPVQIGMYSLLFVPIVLFVLAQRQLPHTLSTASESSPVSRLYWLNILWFWVGLQGYFVTLASAHPFFYGACLIVGFYVAVSFVCHRKMESWRFNSTAYWIIIQGALFLHIGLFPSSALSGGFLMAVYGFIAAKVLLPSLSRLYALSAQRFYLTNIGLIFLAFILYPFALTSPRLTACALVALIITNSFITDTRSNLLSSIYAVIQFILHRIGVRYTGLEHISYQKDERVILIANHSTFLDVPMIATRFDETLTYPIYPFWLDVWFVRVVCGMFADMHGMKPGQSSSLANVIHAIRNGKKCLIFPEGRLTNTGNLMKIYEGTVILAEHAKANIQPVIINGGMNLSCSRQDQRHIKGFFAPVTVTFGSCLPLPTTVLKGKAKRKFIKHALFNRLVDTTMHSCGNPSLIEALRIATRRYGASSLAISDNNFLNDLTYKGLMQRAKLLAVRLKKSLKPGQVLGLTVNASADCAAVYFACFLLEVVVLPIDRHLSSKDFFQLCEKISLDALIVDTESWQEVSHHAHLDHCRAKHIPIIEWAKLTTRISLLEKSAVAVFPARGSSNPPESIPAVLWFNHETGQSTLLSQRNLCQQAYQLQIVTDLQGSDVVFNAVGLQSCFGLLMGLLNPLMSGVTVVMMTRQFMPKFVIDSIYDTQSTILVADSSWLETYAPTEDTHYETMRLRATFTDHKVSDTTRSAWEHHARCYVFSALADLNQAGIVSVNFPYFNHSTPFGRLLPLNELINTKSGQNSSVCGPICPDFIVKSGQSPFGKNTSSCYQLSYSLAENQDGVLIESSPESDAG